MKTKKIIQAGALVLEAIYPRGSAHDSPRTRAGKRKLSSAAQERMNRKHSYQKLELMLAANFRPGDLMITLTYDEQHLPGGRSAAVNRLKRFRADLTAFRREKHRGDMVMIFNTENAFGEGRWHHHLVVNNVGEEFEEIRRLWPWGENIEIRRLKLDNEHSYESLARYLCKEARERPGLRSWSYTRNCKHPEVESFPVEDDTPLQAPKGSLIYEDAREQNEFGSWRYVKYLAPGWEKSLRPAPRHRRRR